MVHLFKNGDFPWQTVSHNQMVGLFLRAELENQRRQSRANLDRPFLIPLGQCLPVSTPHTGHP